MGEATRPRGERCCLWSFLGKVQRHPHYNRERRASRSGLEGHRVPQWTKTRSYGEDAERGRSYVSNVDITDVE